MDAIAILSVVVYLIALGVVITTVGFVHCVRNKALDPAERRHFALWIVIANVFGVVYYAHRMLSADRWHHHDWSHHGRRWAVREHAHS